MTCVDYGAGFQATDGVDMCPSTVGIYSSSACPSTGRVGHCDLQTTVGGITGSETVNYYAGAATDDQMACVAQGGNWNAN